MSEREQHPYGEFIPPHCESLIIGSFPIGKFSDPKRRGEIKETEIDFFFGGERNLLWRILGEVFKRELTTKEKIIRFLSEERIGVGDVIKSCVRKGGRASDSDLLEIEWNRELLKLIRTHRIQKIFFTSRQVERWFRNLYRQEIWPDSVTLPSPSGQAIRGLWRSPEYQNWKKLNPEKPTFAYLVHRYKELFNRD